MIQQIVDYLKNAHPMIQMSAVASLVVLLGIIFVLTYFKKWGWLWREWLTTVDHKKIGVMYLICALIMLFRGGVDALLMRIQLAAPNMHFLDPQHYNEIFSTHGTIMILFVAMPMIFAMMNIAVPLQIGARDVATHSVSGCFSSVRCCLIFPLFWAVRRTPDGWLIRRYPKWISVRAPESTTT